MSSAIPQALVDGIFEGALYALMAAGLTLLFGVLDIINAACGILVVLGAYLSMTLLTGAGINVFVGLLITVPALAIIGALMDAVFIRRLPAVNRVTMSVLATYAFGIIIEGILILIYGTNYHTVPDSYARASVHALGLSISQMEIYGFVLSVGCLAALSYWLFRTRSGRSIRAVMDNPTAARLVGIDVKKVSTITFAVGIGITAVGGMVFGSVQPFGPNTGYDLISRLLTLVVLGGLGSVGGAMAGALVMLVAEDLVAVAWAPNWAPVLYFVVLALVLVMKPEGLFGTKAVRAQ